MKTRYLFQHRYKKIGWLLLITGIISGLSYYIFELEELDFFNTKVYAIFNDSIFGGEGNFSKSTNNILDELIAIVLIIGAIIVAFSKTKIEDELVVKIRMESLVLATYINYGILLLTIILVYGFPFLNIMVFNMFTLLVFFVIIFHVKLFKLNQSQSNEK